MDIWAMNAIVENIIQHRHDLVTEWSQLLSVLQTNGIDGIESDFAGMDILMDVLALRKQLETTVLEDPIPTTVTAIWFGLFDSVGADGLEKAGYYFSGIEHFDPDDGDCFCDPIWKPDSRYLSSLLLDQMYRSTSSQNGQARELMEYVGKLGTAALITRHASGDMFRPLPIVVGFDAGDFVLL